MIAARSAVGRTPPAGMRFMLFFDVLPGAGLVVQQRHSGRASEFTGP